MHMIDITKKEIGDIVIIILLIMIHCGFMSISDQIGIALQFINGSIFIPLIAVTDLRRRECRMFLDKMRKEQELREH